MKKRHKNPVLSLFGAFEHARFLLHEAAVPMNDARLRYEELDLESDEILIKFQDKHPPLKVAGQWAKKPHPRKWIVPFRASDIEEVLEEQEENIEGMAEGLRDVQEKFATFLRTVPPLMESYARKYFGTSGHHGPYVFNVEIAHRNFGKGSSASVFLLKVRSLVPDPEGLSPSTEEYAAHLNDVWEDEWEDWGDYDDADAREKMEEDLLQSGHLLDLRNSAVEQFWNHPEEESYRPWRWWAAAFYEDLASGLLGKLTELGFQESEVKVVELPPQGARVSAKGNKDPEPWFKLIGVWLYEQGIGWTPYQAPDPANTAKARVEGVSRWGRVVDKIDPINLNYYLPMDPKERDLGAHPEGMPDGSGSEGREDYLFLEIVGTIEVKI